MSVGAIIAVLSLNVTLTLVNAGQVAATLPVTGASVTTPIALTSTAHGVPLGRVMHGVVSGVGGTVEANGLWVLTPTDANTFTLSLPTAQGIYLNSVGVHAYTSGGQIQYAFPDYQILLGRRWIQAGSPTASPRIVFVPRAGKPSDMQPFYSEGILGTRPPNRGTLEQQSMRLAARSGTEHLTFDVYCTGSANPPSPDFGDFDAAQAVWFTLYNAMWDAMGDGFSHLGEDWPSQLPTAGTQTQRGQQMHHVVEILVPINVTPLAFVPSGVSLVETVNFKTNPTSGDATVITIT